jgi:alpha-L-fucosidase
MISTLQKAGPGRDLVAEYVEALRKRNLKVGFYYSVINWGWPGFWDPEKYPEELPKIVDELHTQVRELMTNYGKVDILWYDVPAVPGWTTPGCFGHKGIDFKQSAVDFYRSEELNAMVRQIQPHIIINNRSGLPEDFGTPEQRINPEEGGRPWEACMTLNNAPGWGNIRHSVADKNAGEVLYNLMNAVRLGGNFLFNIGPDEKGHVVERDRHALDRIGKWMERHGEAVYGTRPEGIYDQPNQGAAYHYGMFTCRGKIAYFTIFYYPGDYVLLTHIGPAVRKAELLTTGEELKVEAISNDRWKISGLPSEPPCDLAPVIKIEFESAPYLKTFRGADWLDGKHTD